MTQTLTRNARAANDYFDRQSLASVGPLEVSSQQAGGEEIVIIDVRPLEDFRKGRVPGALNCPQNEWGSFNVLRRDALNIVYGSTQSSGLAADACARFAGQGYRVMEMDGGFASWKNNSLPVERDRKCGRVGVKH
jgi:rhodanese-related sulfurtransferase